MLVAMYFQRFNLKLKLLVYDHLLESAYFQRFTLKLKLLVYDHLLESTMCP